ncbi:hypothetical protein V8G54_011704, partial [Vigna mungo]
CLFLLAKRVPFILSLLTKFSIWEISLKKLKEKQNLGLVTLKELYIKWVWVRALNTHKLGMARNTLSSLSLSLCILLIITFTLFMHSTPVKADLKMRKLGVQPKAPPPPLQAFQFKPPVVKPPILKPSPPPPPPIYMG